jgi:DNA-binding MarR family transcriptional regulator
MAFQLKEQATLSNLMMGLLPLQGRMSLPQLVALLAVANEPGISVNEVADRIGAPQQTASRHVSVLMGRYSAPDAPGGLATEPLIEQTISADDPRKRALRLTPHGRDVLASLSRTINRT